MFPSINVNLNSNCDCDGPHPAVVRGSSLHTSDCATAPILIPCPIPRSIHLMVALGECSCGGRETFHSTTHDRGTLHMDACPARPVKVVCSISGKTWDSTFVSDVDWQWREDRGNRSPSPMSQADREVARRAPVERWTLVKALVLDKGWSRSEWALAEQRAIIERTFERRDEVFAALADMARAEEAALKAQQRVDDAFPFARYRRNDVDHRAERPSHGRLAAYVEHLIEQVGVLP